MFHHSPPFHLVRVRSHNLGSRLNLHPKAIFLNTSLLVSALFGTRSVVSSKEEPWEITPLDGILRSPTRWPFPPALSRKPQKRSPPLSTPHSAVVRAHRMRNTQPGQRTSLTMILALSTDPAPHLHVWLLGRQTYLARPLRYRTPAFRDSAEIPLFPAVSWP